MSEVLYRYDIDTGKFIEELVSNISAKHLPHWYKTKSGAVRASLDLEQVSVDKLELKISKLKEELRNMKRRLTPAVMLLSILNASPMRTTVERKQWKALRAKIAKSGSLIKGSDGQFTGGFYSEEWKLDDVIYQFGFEGSTITSIDIIEEN